MKKGGRYKNNRTKILSFIIITALFFSFLPIIPLSFYTIAKAETFTEDFSSDLFKDSANTTADWNTTSGKLRLPQLSFGWSRADGSTPGTDNVSNNTGISRIPQIALDSSDRPNIVWEDNTNTTGNCEILFSRWNGSAWTRANGTTPGYDNVSNNSGDSRRPRIALDSSQRPNIVWDDDTTGNGDIFFTKWNGSAWTKANGSTPGFDNVSNTGDPSNYPQILLDSSQRPNIVWVDYCEDIFFSKWNGSAWTKANGSTPGFDNVSNTGGSYLWYPKMVLDSSSRPNIVWLLGLLGSSDIAFSKWSGSAWTKADGTTPGYDNISNNAGDSANPQIVLDSLQRPNIVWHDNTLGSSNYEIFFSRWKSPAWSKADGTPGYDNVSNNASWSEDPQIILDSTNKPNIVWEEYCQDISFTKWNGSAWTKADGVTLGYDNVSNMGWCRNPKMTLDSSQGPNIVWDDKSYIYFSKWNGTTWTKADGTTSGHDDVGPGAYDPLYAEYSPDPQLALNSSQKPNIVWVYPIPGYNPEIAFSKYTGIITFSSNAQAQSTKINLVPSGQDVIKATLSANQNLNGQTLNYYLSANGGTNWESVASGVEHTFTNQGTDLRWKAVLSTANPSVTPEVDSISINYTLEEVDNDPPTGSILINNGDSYTNNRNVTLSLTASDNVGVTQMIISDDYNFTGANWETYATSKSFTLSSGDGTKNVYVKYRDAKPNESEIYSDSIVLDTTGPTGSIYINGGASQTSSLNVVLSLSANDTSGVDKMMISNYSNFQDANWENYTITKNWILSSGYGQKAVYVKFKDILGNSGQTYSDFINYIQDNEGPTGSIMINNNATTINSVNVTLSLSFQDDITTTSNAKMMLSNDISFNGANWENFTNTKAWLLTSGDGEKIVYVKFKDEAGLESSVYSDSIILQTGTVPVKKIVERIYGPTRYETAIEICKKGWIAPNTVILTRGDLFPDALAGSSISSKYDAPILLTWPSELHPSTKAEIERLKPRNIIILGSENAVSKNVEDTLKSLGIANITRLGGPDRYDTAGLIANALGSTGEKMAIISTGENFPDALASASIAFYKRIPIFLVGNNKISAEIQKAFTNLGIKKVMPVGGADVVPDGYVNWFTQNGATLEQRLAGEDRYGTAKAIAEYGISKGMDALKVYIATGENFPDALTCGPLAGKNRSPILLTSNSLLRTQTKDWLSSNKAFIYFVYIAGGPDVVSDEVKEEISEVIAK